MVTGRPRMLNISEIKLLPQLQVRCEINQEAVEEYAAAMALGKHFPPVDVYQVGDQLLLVNGFHRIAAAKLNKSQRIAAIVTKGEMENALWASLTANIANSNRMTRADKVRAIKLALELSPESSDRFISDRLCVDHKTVSRYRSELQSRGEIPHVERVGRDGKTYPSPTPRPPALPPIEDLPPPAISDDPPPSIDDDGPPPAIDVVTDQLSNVITRPDIAAVFKRLGELTRLSTAISDVKAAVLQGALESDPLFAGIVASNVQNQCEHLRGSIEGGKPFALCPYCIGNSDGCRSCKGLGWCTQSEWDMVPKDVRSVAIGNKPSAA